MPVQKNYNMAAYAPAHFKIVIIFIDTINKMLLRISVNKFILFNDF